jgi:hypothetical protein
MAKKTRVTQQRTREEQWRRRVASQTQPNGAGAGGAVADPMLDPLDVDTLEVDGATAYEQAAIRPMPSNVTTSAAASRSATRSTGTGSGSSAAQRKASTVARTARTRLPVNTMSLEDEMNYVRSDIRSLIILTAMCLAVIIVLAFIIQ